MRVINVLQMMFTGCLIYGKDMINFEIRAAALVDVPHLWQLIREFAAFENLSEYCEVTEASLRSVLFGENSFAGCLLAFADRTPIAYAIFFPYFSSFRGQRSIYLEDIYIQPDFRQHGLGEKMLREIAKIGQQKGARRMDFQVLKRNEKAIGFYRKFGAVSDESETHFKFTDEAFEKLTR
jgi:ribosomal protein S18 acetylase RimI-like enzyme